MYYNYCSIVGYNSSMLSMIDSHLRTLLSASSRCLGEVGTQDGIRLLSQEDHLYGEQCMLTEKL